MSTKDFGCFFCIGKATDESATCPKCGKRIDISQELKHVKLGDYQVTGILGRGFNGWTVLAEDNFQSFAIKIIPEHRLKERGLKEPRALAECSPHRNIARFFRVIECEIVIDTEKSSVSCLVFEYVPNARPLGHVVEDDSVKLSKGDVVAILCGIASGLARMEKNNLWHDDLHDDNILIREVQADENLIEQYEAKLIDFGSTKPRNPNEQETGDRGDYSYLSKHIYSLVHRFEHGNQTALTPSDRTFAARLRRLAHRLDDRNVSRRSMSPSDVFQEIRAAHDECSTGHNYPSFSEMKDQSGVALSEPLGNANALYLAPQDIALLFSDVLGWERRLEKSEPVLVVGPRGCGKTMLLRYLSAGSCARPKRDEITQEDVRRRLLGMPHIGFLINVGQLRTPFLRSAYKELENQHKHIAEEFCREFLNLSFGFEIVRTLIWLDTEQILPLTDDDKKLLCSLLSTFFPDDREPQRESLHSYAEALDRRVMSLSNLRKPSEYSPTGFARDDVLHLFAQTLRRASWGGAKEIWFLIDDYSVTVIPELAQKAYNPVLFRPSSELRIKISSEGDGPNLTDTIGRKYREGRELSKVNLGEVYFQSEEQDGRAFFEGILDARFRETGKGSVEELQRLLGEHTHGANFGAYIIEQRRAGDARFYGFGLLCELCSGDVSFIIELLHSITKGRWHAQSAPIKEKDQDAIVKRFAQGQLTDLRNIADYGMKLHTFANCMGGLIKSYLLNSTGDKPDERLRIEIEGTGDLGQEAQRMHEALLRYSVLVSGGAGKSKAGLPTKKLYFRRMFAPCFPFSPHRSGCIAISVKEYERWLLDPKTMGGQGRRKKPPDPGTLLV